MPQPTGCQRAVLLPLERVAVRLLERVWGERGVGDMRPMRTLINKLRRKLGDAGAKPTYIFTERRVGYRMPKGEAAVGNLAPLHERREL